MSAFPSERGAARALIRPWGTMHYRVDGEGPTVVFANSLGTDLRLWDGVLPLLPPIRAVRYDMRGHGLTDRGPQQGILGLAEDAAALIEAVGGEPALFVGLSVGGMTGLALAARRPDLLRGLVLANSAVRMGTPEAWVARIDAVRAGGVASIADAVMERWFAPAFRRRPELSLWRTMLARTDAEGYAAACGSIAPADLSADAAGLSLPVLVIAGSEDGASPPALVEATARLIPGAAFHVIGGAGHLTPVEAPADFVALAGPFIEEHAA